MSDNRVEPVFSAKIKSLKKAKAILAEAGIPCRHSSPKQASTTVRSAVSLLAMAMRYKNEPMPSTVAEPSK